MSLSRTSLEKTVCSLENEKCMLRKDCKNCPELGELKQFLTDLSCLADVDSISYKQWVSTDRTTLESLTKETAEFIDILAQKVFDLTSHHYVSKAQSAFLKKN